MDSPDTRIGLAFGSSRLPCQSAAHSITPRTGRSSLIAAVQPQTPDPSTPELCREDTPTTSSIPTTPEDDSDSDRGTPVPLSPSIAREHRARLRRIAPLGLPPSSKLRPRHTLRYNKPPNIPFITSTEKVVDTESPKTISLNPVENVHKLEDIHDILSSSAQLSTPQKPETSSHPPKSPLIGHSAAVKLEVEDPIPPSDLGGDLDEVPSPSGLCDPSTTPATPKASDNVECDRASTMIDAMTSLTTNTDLGTGEIKAPDLPGAEDDSLKLSVSWRPSATLLRLLPPDVIERLRDSPILCVATTVKGARCKNKNAAKLTTEHVDKLLKGLSTLPSLLELTEILTIAKDFVCQATCKQSHRKAAEIEFIEINSYTTFENTEEVSKATTNVSGTETTKSHSAFRLWAQRFLTQNTAIHPMVKNEVETSDEVPGTASTVKADQPLSDDKSMTQVPVEREKEEPRRPGKDAKPTNTLASVSWAGFQTKISVRARRKTAFPPRTFNPESRSCHLYHDFRPYLGSAKDKTKSASELIREWLEKPLSQADSKAEGNIYMYWHPGNFGYVKIGKSINTKKRLQDWQRQCKMEVEQVTNSEKVENFEVRHPHRVERLIHAELKEYRHEEPECPGCHRSHNEWFYVNANLALRVVEKWSEQSLYEGKFLRESLTKAEIEKLCELTTVTTPEKVKPRRKRASTGRTRHLRKSSPGTGLVIDPVATTQDDTKEIYTWRFSL